MKRRLAMLLSATLVAGFAAVLVPASPASAGVHVCGGVGTAVLGSGLTYPVTVSQDLGHPIHALVTQQPRMTTFGFSLDQAGACVNSNAPNVKSTLTGTVISADGVVSGWCGLSSGSGTLRLGNDPRFAWIGIGGTLVLTGGVVGVVNAVPDPLAANNSCNSNNGASRFFVQGAVVATDHCTAKSKGLTTIDNPLGVLSVTNILPVATVSVHAAGTWHVWTKVCVPVPVL